ncbi:ribonuclease E/G [Lachnobacterium bovis]|uniref:Ribonuclease G n=1 Tax=Lachnobacterium bovis TaxID=140626 RepID=A0A1H9QQW0_9FIRM|nr:ribonuclease E/G [Lachnobacterium bovis]SER62800.1 ribonuclease G [Lachnobacterium bovis]
MNRLAITNIEIHNKTYLAYNLLDERRNLIDFQIFSNDSMLNNIYVGKVENVIENLNAAFVRISQNQRCYLPLNKVNSIIFVKKNSKKNKLVVGDEIVVQIVKDAVKTKEPVASCELTFEGDYSVLTTKNKKMGVSRKLDENTKSTFNEILQKYKEPDFGIVIRTNAKEVDLDKVECDIKKIITKYKDIKEHAKHKSMYDILYNSPKGFIAKIKSQNSENIDYIYTDIKDVYDEINNHLGYIVQKKMLKFYDDKDVSLKTLYNIRSFVDELTQKKVKLKSGANIIIEALETLTIIDVNTSKCLKKENVIEKVNSEAAIEIARQLRLRNISGMIIIDFINMDSKEKNYNLIQCLKKEIAKDPVKTDFIDITKLGLVELTRKKISKSLIDIIREK